MQYTNIKPQMHPSLPEILRPSEVTKKYMEPRSKTNPVTRNRPCQSAILQANLKKYVYFF